MNIANIIESKLLSKKTYFVCLTIISVAVAILYMLSFKVTYSDIQTRRDASGFEHQYASRFFYFYYYTGNFPLATLDTNLTYSREGAKNQIENNGKNLLMEYKHWSRLGEHARIFCYLPNAIVKGSAVAPSVRLFNAIFFLLGLLFLYRGFYVARKPLLGLLLCVSVLLTPYFHYEVFRNENIFALQACTFFMVLGLLLPFLFSEVKIKAKTILLVFAACFAVAFCSEVRNEISAVFLCLLLMIFLSRFSFRNKIILLLFSFTFFFGVKKCIQFYFEKKYEQTQTLVASKGGHVYTGNRIKGHNIWHPIFCGLGDFDTKYGYVWNDTVAYRYATPILNSVYHLSIKYSGKLHTDNYYDSAKLYYVKFDEIPEYEKVVKGKVMHDIQSNPAWYFEILFKRIIKIFTATLPFPFLGILAFLMLLFFIYKRKWIYVKLILITLPLSVTSFIIFSGKGATYNSMFGYMALAILLYEILFIKKELQ